MYIPLQCIVFYCRIDVPAPTGQEVIVIYSEHNLNSYLGITDSYTVMGQINMAIFARLW